MGLPSNTNALQNGFWQGYTVGRSLRFRASGTTYINRTPSVASNQKTWTWSAWVKRGSLTSAQRLFVAGGTSGTPGQGTAWLFQANDTFLFQSDSAASMTFTSTAVYRDSSAWYHLVVALDTTQATANNRIRFYVNGSQVTGTYTGTITQNADLTVNSTVNHRMAQHTNDQYFDGYFAEVNFIDGQQLTPSSFGAYDNNGIWEPIKYTGTYGTNGFYLPFSNTTSTTTLVADASGNGNNWTPNNISLTAGATYDSMLDSPTNSNLSSNYCVFNPLYSVGGTTFSNANLQAATGTSTAGRTITTMGVSSGKWYWEITPTSIPANVVSIGVVPSNPTTYDSGTVGNNASEYAYLSNGQKFSAGVASAYGASYVANDVIGVALDCDGGTITFYKNNVSQGSAFSIASSTTYIPAVSDSSATDTATFVANFGQRSFTYTPPTGFNSLNTYNIPASLVQNGSQYMSATTYTGTGSTLSITNNGNNAGGYTFQPDLVWIKSRSAVSDHAWYDSVRGATFDIASNLATGQTTQSTGVTSFDSNGFTIGSLAKINTNAATYVAWQWRAGQGTTSTNTSGSITSTVSVSAQSGFSVVSYTGTGAAATIGHGLGVAPQMIFVKKTSASDNWGVYHVSDPSPAASYALTLNSTANAGLNTTYWNAVAPTSSVFSVGTATQTNTSGATHIAYCFAPVNGYSSFGSYAGNGSATDGPFVYTGFRPRFILVKRSVGGIASWAAFDTSRSAFNLSQSPIYPNVTNAEATVSFGDILSNGFKLRATAGEMNGASSTYVYAAFAENPFSISRAR